MEKKLSFYDSTSSIVWVQCWRINEFETFESRGNTEFKSEQGCAKIRISWQIRYKESEIKWNVKFAFYWKDFTKKQLKWMCHVSQIKWFEH